MGSLEMNRPHVGAGDHHGPAALIGRQEQVGPALRPYGG